VLVTPILGAPLTGEQVARNTVLLAQVADRVLGWTHGHLAKVAGATPQKKLQTWWEKQSLSMDSPVRDADLLVTAHYHHFSLAMHRRRRLAGPDPDAD
jgi:hypothetical protein